MGSTNLANQMKKTRLSKTKTLKKSLPMGKRHKEIMKIWSRMSVLKTAIIEAYSIEKPTNSSFNDDIDLDDALFGIGYVEKALVRMVDRTPSSNEKETEETPYSAYRGTKTWAGTGVGNSTLPPRR